MRDDINEKLLEIAKSEIGVKEISGNEDNPRITEYKQSTPLVAKSHDEVPWCASFVNWVLGQAGVQGTGNPMARSFMNWGRPLKDPVPGCVVVLKRGTSRITGHVGFFVYRRSPGGWVHVLGGNQSDQVRISLYAESDVLAYRNPEDTKEDA